MNHAKPTLVRFSLRTLLVLMMLLCIALATTVSASPQAARVLRWIVVFGPLVAIFLAAYSARRERRTFWLGYAGVGLWAYTFSSFGPNYFDGRARSLAEFLRGPLIKMHEVNLEQRAEDVLHEDARFAASSRNELKSQFSRNWAYVITNARAELIQSASGILELNLLLAVAMVGGLAVANLNQWQHAPRWRRES